MAQELTTETALWLKARTAIAAAQAAAVVQQAEQLAEEAAHPELYRADCGHLTDEAHPLPCSLDASGYCEDCAAEHTNSCPTCLS